MKIFRSILVFVFIGLNTAPVSAQDNSAQEHGHLHHVHMNVGSIEETTAFYTENFGVVAMKYNDKVPALMTERAFLLMEEMPRDQIKNHLMTTLFHVSWSGVDLPLELIRLQQKGVEIYTGLTPLFPGSYYIYLYGPDHEVIEIFDVERRHRFNHVHQVVYDADESADWFVKNVNPVIEREVRGGGGVNLFFDNVGFSMIELEGSDPQFRPRENTTGKLEPTDGTNLDHLAFSFKDLDAAYARMQAQGTDIETPISVDRKYGFRHFFARAPSGLLVEFVEGSSWPAAAWE